MRNAPGSPQFGRLSAWPGRRGILCALLVATLGCDTTPRAGGVVLVILDTARADHLSSYGYFRETTPNIDRLAGEGVRYRNAFAQAPWTLPAVATILTGQPPHVHGAGRGRESIFPASAIREDVTTLAERLRDRGFRTGAFMNVAWCRPQSGLARGFDRYDIHLTDVSNTDHRNARETTDAALEWMRGVGDDPYFLVVHYFDPHLVYSAPEGRRLEADDSLPLDFGSAATIARIRRNEIALDSRARETLIERYDAELAYTDAQFGRLRAGLEALDRFDDSLVIVVADHGEEFWDHGGFEHGHSHYRELLHVPLIVRPPGGQTAEVVDDRVRQLDIAPTILEYASAPGSDELPGVRLGEPVTHSIAEGSLWAGDLVSVSSDDGDLIFDRTTGKAIFFGPHDPGQRAPRPVREALHLLEAVRALPPSRRDVVDALPAEGELAQLRALGYVD